MPISKAKWSMYRKERKEHPSFTNKQIWRIVKDHFTKER